MSPFWLEFHYNFSEKSILNPVEHNSQHIKINYCAINVTGQHNIKSCRQCASNIYSQQL